MEEKMIKIIIQALMFLFVDFVGGIIIGWVVFVLINLAKEIIEELFKK